MVEARLQMRLYLTRAATHDASRYKHLPLCEYFDTTGVLRTDARPDISSTDIDGPRLISPTSFVNDPNGIPSAFHVLMGRPYLERFGRARGSTE